ncbi:MAG: HPr family phosphocarrier protein [Planctomycetota bacterium]|nr:HPr family phosphocarrier protein [Planctomycetota bacterium]
MASRTVTIVNPQGLHARPADAFVRLAHRFVASVAVIKDEQRANGKSILDILMLAAEFGSQLTIEASGGDAEEAVDALALLLESRVPAEEAAV